MSVLHDEHAVLLKQAKLSISPVNSYCYRLLIAFSKQGREECYTTVVCVLEMHLYFHLNVLTMHLRLPFERFHRQYYRVSM